MGWTCGHTGKASAVPHNTSASTSWILVKVDMLSSVCSSVHPGELLGYRGFPGNSSRSWLKSCRAPVKFFSLSAMARSMLA